MRRFPVCGFALERAHCPWYKAFQESFGKIKRLH